MQLSAHLMALSQNFLSQHKSRKNSGREPQTCGDAKHMGVSRNSGTPKWMVYNGKPHQNDWFGGTTIFGNIHILFNKKIQETWPNSQLSQALGLLKVEWSSHWPSSEISMVISTPQNGNETNTSSNTCQHAPFPTRETVGPNKGAMLKFQGGGKHRKMSFFLKFQIHMIHVWYVYLHFL